MQAGKKVELNQQPALKQLVKCGVYEACLKIKVFKKEGKLLDLSQGAEKIPKSRDAAPQMCIEIGKKEGIAIIL